MEDRTYSVNKTAEYVARMLKGSVTQKANRTYPTANIEISYNDETFNMTISLGGTKFPGE